MDTPELSEVTLEEYADTNGLKLEVRERRRLPEGDPSRFYAYFKHCSIREGRWLVGAFGNGATPEEATINYGLKVHSQTLVYENGITKREIHPVRIKPHV